MDIAVRLPGDRLAEAIELTADWLAHPRVSQGTLDAARHSLQADLEAAQDDSDWRAAHAALAKLYGSLRPLGRPAEGHSASLERITLDDVRRFHARWIRPERTIVAVAGHADPRRAIETIEGAFARWNAGTPSEAPPLAESRPTASGRVHVSLPHKEQGSIAVALPGLGRTDRDYAAVRALNYLLGETGYAGRLGRALVDTGIAYAVYTTLGVDPDPGPIVIQTNAVDTEAAVRRILSTLQDLSAEGVGDRERREAQGYLLGRLLFRFESASVAAEALAERAHAGAAGEWEAFATNVRALTTADLNRVAATYYTPSRAAIAVAGR